MDQKTHEHTLDAAKKLVQQAAFSEAEDMMHDFLLNSDLSQHARRDGLYTLAVSQRYQKKLDSASETLKELRSHAPDYGRGYQELGHTYLEQKQVSLAIKAYENAVHHNPALQASWRALVNLYGLTERHESANAAAQEIVRFANLPPELVSVSALIHDKELYKAERLCRHFLRNNRHHVEAMRLLAEIGVKLEMLDDAEFLLESCVEFEPEYNRARFEYADVLLRRHKFQKALEQAQILNRKEPDNLAIRSLVGSATVGLGDHEEAISIFDEVLAKEPNQTKVYVTKGHALKTIGRFDDAIASYQQAYKVEPNHGDAFWSLANTKVYEFTDQEIEHMRREEASRDIALDDRIHMCFALGKALEDRGDFEGAFHYYFCGNTLKQDEMRHTPQRLAARIRAQKEVCTRDFFDQYVGVGSQTFDPIFIVGLPRAGSTLLEQIIASHSQVDGTLELPHILSLVNRLRDRNLPESEQGSRYPRILHDLDADLFARFGEQYLTETRVFRAGAPRFIDKMPNNFVHVGLIKLILPHAKVIDARRHPMACCFSGFKQLFGEGQDFSYGLPEMGNYYREYVGLMKHWDEVLPGFVLRVNHEDVIEDLEGQVRRVLEFLDLEFESGCVEYYKTKRSIRTPSSEQVRQPIYRSGMEVWRNFEKWLDPLKKELGPDILRAYRID
ncbi:MAG: sulfotransferase [Pseudomonadota bacterium]